ncbi:nuclease-related domain-containing protein [Neobacillus niacini]|uniref:nuclease-related domain-containing protein n=1 Tax=Neobacillus niacini TaxID=86668 RepID=UPI0021CB5B05|nr:nuclease-related domain-containing protein [Neobacillus niacini]MCM3768060.1 NERD domain-containing protein [Neobacillus niacini]
MNLKPLKESKKLKIYHSLNVRDELNSDQKLYYQNLKAGYEGELYFQSLTDQLQCECYVINDLRLEVGNTTFQIDSLILFQNIFNMNEVKNFYGDYYYEGGKFYDFNGKERNDPLVQLTRCESSLRQLQLKLGCKLPVEANVVHVNPQFTLYQAPRNKPIILPTQVPRYLQRLDHTPSRLNGYHKKLAEKLISLHVEESPYTNKMPAYEFGSLRKGLTCGICLSLSVSVDGQRCVCGVCGHEEKVELAVLRGVAEILLLFPEMKITTNLVYEWCGGAISKKTIFRILLRNFDMVGDRRWTNFVQKR